MHPFLRKYHDTMAGSLRLLRANVVATEWMLHTKCTLS